MRRAMSRAIEKERARLRCLAALPRPTVEDRKRSDEIIADTIWAVSAAVVLSCITVLAAALG